MKVNMEETRVNYLLFGRFGCMSADKINRKLAAMLFGLSLYLSAY